MRATAFRNKERNNDCSVSDKGDVGDSIMKKLILALAVLSSSATVALAQSLPNFGADAPAYGDSYGKPVSGTYPPVGYGGYGGGYGAGGYRAYAYQPWRQSYRRHWHRHSW